MAINIISSSPSSFNAYELCNFYTTGQKAITPYAVTGDVMGVGPPQPIYSVSCAPTPGGNATCLPVYGTLHCFWLPIKINEALRW